MLCQFASGYLAGADPRTPLASPLLASLSGLPPLLVQAGAADLLLSDSERLARAAAETGVDVSLESAGPAPRLPDHARHPELAKATERIGKFPRARVR
jgi:epsilon-lactone hydrolase